jgi:hypothetical protein
VTFETDLIVQVHTEPSHRAVGHGDRPDVSLQVPAGGFHIQKITGYQTTAKSR